MSDPRPPRYLKQMNKVVKGLQKLGIHTGPAMVLTVPGRKSGHPRSTPMTPFEFQGGLYTVAGFPRADWAANARAAGAGTLSRGRKSRRVKIVELDPGGGASGVAGVPCRGASRCRVREAVRACARRNTGRIRGPRGQVSGVPVRPAVRPPQGRTPGAP